jgi:hypothetical protein
MQAESHFQLEACFQKGMRSAIIIFDAGTLPGIRAWICFFLPHRSSFLHLDICTFSFNRFHFLKK